MIARWKKIFRIQGRSRSWKKVKKRTEELIRERKQGYLEYQVKKSVEKGGLGNRFAALTKPLQSVDKVPNFDVKSVCHPGSSDLEAANECADYFSAISDEFEPLDLGALPVTYSLPLPHIDQREVADRLRVMRKPRSMVPGDIFPQLVTNYAVVLSFPLADIYNAVTREYHSPLVWRREFVTIIPKGLNPEDLGQCRNISCTNLFSKVLESFMLDWSWSQISENLQKNQYGGQKNCGTDHFLADLWTGLMEDLEDNRACASLVSLNFSKAFNRLDHAHVLRSYARLGASTQVISLFASFLSGRTMRVKVADTLSSPRRVNGGAPQGSCAGVQIYTCLLYTSPSPRDS